MSAVNELKSILDNCHYGFTVINNDLGMELEQHTPNGTRYIRGRFEQGVEMAKQDLPQFATVSARYEDNADKWEISKAEMSYLLQQVRTEVFSEYDRANRITSYVMNIGQYFYIEGYHNFLKDMWAEGDDHFYLRCGTGNSSYERTYKGLFYMVDNPRRGGVDVYCLGYKFNDRISCREIDDKIKGKEPKLFHAFTYQPGMKYYYQYR